MVGKWISSNNKKRWNRFNHACNTFSVLIRCLKWWSLTAAAGQCEVMCAEVPRGLQTRHRASCQDDLMSQGLTGPTNLYCVAREWTITDLNDARVHGYAMHTLL